MGFSEWYHIDFKVIRRIVKDRSKNECFELIAEDGKIYVFPKRFVADAWDYSPGDRNGTISIREELAKKLGVIDEND